MTGTANLATSAVFAVFVLYAVWADSALQLSQTGYGLLFASIAAGSVVGALIGERLHRRLGFAHTMLASILTFTVALATPALTTNVCTIAAGFLIGGAGLGLFNVIGVALRQRLTPDRILGRLTSAYRLLAWGSQPIGAALGGLIGQTIGLRWVFGAAAVLALLTALGATQLTAANLRAAEAADEQPAVGQ